MYLTESSFKTYANYKNFWIFSNDQGSGNPNATSSTSSSSSSSTETSVSYTRYVSTSSSNLNVRSGAGTSYSIITSLSKGTAVTVTKTSGNWSYITNPAVGWVSTQYLSSSKVTTTSSSSSSSSSTSSSSTSTTYYTIKNKCYIYANSSMSGTKYCYIANTKVKLLSKTSSNIYYIQVVKTGRKGYIYVSNLTGVTTTSTTSSSSSSSSSSYTTGTYKVTASLLNVRSGAGTSYSKKTYSQLTSNARKQNKSLGNYYANGYLKGVVCTVTQVKGNWGKTASGWICLDYCTKQ